MEHWKGRRAIERRIVEQVVDDLLAGGYWLAIDDPDLEEPHEISGPFRDREEVLGRMFACDDDRLLVYTTNDGKKSIGWVLFVYGNDGTDVVSDYTTNLEPHMKWAADLADRIEEAGHHQVWMPMKSAPDDGRDILVALDDGICAVADFRKIHNLGGVVHKNQWWAHGYGIVRPSAWMPRPIAPKT